VKVRIVVTKAVDVDDDIAKKMLSDFIDWLDEQSLVRALPNDIEYNMDLVKRYLEEKEIG
jgi:hypothetical protein